VKPSRSESHKRFIRSLPCLVCGRRAEPAHVGPHAMKQKASDFSVVPLCREHHRNHKFALDQGRRKFEAYFGINLNAVIHGLTQKPRLWILRDGRQGMLKAYWKAHLPNVPVDDFVIGPVSQLTAKQAAEIALDFYREQYIEQVKTDRVRAMEG
jgi:hypothetical protein